VAAAGEDAVTIAGESQTPDRVGVSRKARNLSPCLQVPQANGPVLAAQEQLPAGRRECRTADRPFHEPEQIAERDWDSPRSPAAQGAVAVDRGGDPGASVMPDSENPPAPLHIPVLDPAREWTAGEAAGVDLRRHPPQPDFPVAAAREQVLI